MLGLSLEHGSSASTVHKCRLVPDDPLSDNGNFYAMKVMSYFKGTKKEKRKTAYNAINPYAKTYQQI